MLIPSPRRAYWLTIIKGDLCITTAIMGIEYVLKAKPSNKYLVVDILNDIKQLDNIDDMNIRNNNKTVGEY